MFYDPVIITADTALFELNVPIQWIFEALLCSSKNGSIKPGSIFGQILKPNFQVFREFLLFLVADVLRNLKVFSKHPQKTQFIHASQGDFSFCQVTTAHKIKVTWRLKARVWSRQQSYEHQKNMYAKFRSHPNVFVLIFTSFSRFLKAMKARRISRQNVQGQFCWQTTHRNQIAFYQENSARKGASFRDRDMLCNTMSVFILRFRFHTMPKHRFFVQKCPKFDDINFWKYIRILLQKIQILNINFAWILKILILDQLLKGRKLR